MFRPSKIEHRRLDRVMPPHASVPLLALVLASSPAWSAPPAPIVLDEYLCDDPLCELAVDDSSGLNVLSWDRYIGGGLDPFGYDVHYTASATAPDPAGEGRIQAGGIPPYTDPSDPPRCGAYYHVRAYSRGRKVYTPALTAAAPSCGPGGSDVVVDDTVAPVVVDNIVTVPSCPASQSPELSLPPDGWNGEGSWSEEFAMGSLQELIGTGRWTTAQPWGSGTIVNGESQYYVDEAGVDSDSPWSPFVFTTGSGLTTTDGNYLVIRAAPYVNESGGELTPRSDPTAKYASGILTSPTEGGTVEPPVYVEVRAKMPRGRGAYPAIWLFDARLTGGNEELDIIEYIAQSFDGSTWVQPALFDDATWETMYHAYHDSRGGSVQTWTNSDQFETPHWCGLAVDFTSEFHTYGLKYTSDEVVWYMDGVQVLRIIPRQGTGEGLKVKRFPSAEMYLNLNLALDLSWFESTDPGKPDCCLSDATTLAHFYNTTGNEVTLAVDYVRVYKPEP